ncbi:MAG: VOC family protein [Nitratireductor sp.]|nr:VOC family protein [Nitratireductor sp.]
MTHSSGIPALDHVVVNVHGELDESVARYERLGFLVTERGHHSLGSSNNLAVFQNTYLELLGYLPGRNELRPGLWVHPPGLSGLVFKNAEPGKLYDELVSRGLPVLEPLEFSRPVDLPTGPEDAAFTVVRIDGDAVQNGRTFFCCHHTPELVWRPEWQKHPNGATDIVGFVIATADPDRAVSPFRAMFENSPILPAEGGFQMQAGTARIEFLTPETVEARFHGAALTSPNGTDRMVAISLHTGTPRFLQDLLTRNEVPRIELPDGSTVIEHRQAANVAVHFVA